MLDFEPDIDLLSWILALTLSQVCFIVLDFGLDIVSSVLSCLGL